ncbi:MFS transporter [Marivirga tractuosa]|uniref:Major facilitator superfamily MFS_1 n=1 Tax=Marivirga tractuosa (strain ATCC 23168 / DSM 4126 / NBRC 15989 / NCIMB 1408 / VKM B-1430 / H-43) TaxID=643867 RepID=E4TT35_MARTH|nr:MFS transporter [Marivirga tractuosa]ADR20883.1 major facilitator superfamily MFS_1 [Marivirga tractuosa DSM 4126]BDD14666.1 MFS transporter [Marivirga tractuosa]
MTQPFKSPLIKARWAISTIFFCYGLTFASWASRIPSIQEKFSLSEAELGTLLLMLPIGSFISLPIAGVLVAKWNSFSVTRLSIVLYLISLVAISISESIYLLGLVLFLFGLMGNMVNIAINTQAVSLEKEYKKNIMASFHGMWSLAGFFGAIIGAFMIGNEIVLQYHYTIIFATSILASIISFKFLIKSDIDEEDDKPIFVIPDKSLLLLGVIAFCSMMCEGTMFDWSGVYYKKIVNAPKDILGLAYTFFMVSMAGTRFVADYFTTKFGVKKVVFFSGLLNFSGLLILILFPGRIISLIAFFIIGAGVSSVIPLVFSLAGKSKTMSSSVALASVSTMGFFGFLLGPPLIGYLAAWLNLQASFSFIALMALCVTILATRIKSNSNS